MRALDLPLLADENIHPEVVEGLRALGKDVVTVCGEGLGGRDDAKVLEHAHGQGRVVLTHDSDFGSLAIGVGRAFTGVIYLRPGHISPAFVLETISAVESLDIEAVSPFLVVAEWRGGTVRVRFRSSARRPLSPG